MAPLAAGVIATVLVIAGSAVAIRIWTTPTPGDSNIVTPVPTPAAAPELQTITVDTSYGAAQVFRDGKLVGTTPLQLQARPGEKINLILRRDGYDDMPVDFDSTERRSYTYTLQPHQER